ncbi:MAG: ArdC family protein [Acidobacteriota bacterium]|nr:ArdC family protein [Acidobacteriota bacterium]
MRTAKIDIYGEITDQIIEAIEVGADNYQMPWHVNGADSVLPVNASTHRPYRGVNVMMLWAVAAKNEYPTSLWATCKTGNYLRMAGCYLRMTVATSYSKPQQKRGFSWFHRSCRFGAVFR